MNYTVTMRALGRRRFSPIDPKGTEGHEHPGSECVPMADGDKSDERAAIERAARDLDDSGQ
jgi:hypothetical protein